DVPGLEPGALPQPDPCVIQEPDEGRVTAVLELATLAGGEQRPDLILVEHVGGVERDTRRLHVSHRVAALGNLALLLAPLEELPDPVVAVLRARRRVAAVSHHPGK